MTLQSFKRRLGEILGVNLIDGYYLANECLCEAAKLFPKKREYDKLWILTFDVILLFSRDLFYLPYTLLFLAVLDVALFVELCSL